MIAALALAVAAAGCGGAGQGGSAPHDGWVDGVVLGGRPMCPTPAAAGPLCHSGPLPHGVVVVIGPDVTRRVRADLRGRFRFMLPPGRYEMHGPGGASRMVRVVAGREVHVQLPAPHRMSSAGR
ncbi:MAG: hypothetical protein ACXVY5_04480 [Gaiellales bacterium]